MIRGENDIQAIGCRFYFMRKRLRTIVTILCAGLLLWGCGWQDMQLLLDEQMAKYTIGEAEEVTSVSGDKYAYQTLDAEDRLIYDQMLAAVMKHESDVVISTKDVDRMDHAYACMMADYGGLFWINGYSYQTYLRKDRIIGVTFSPSYTMTEETRNKYQEDIDGVVDQWLQQLPAGAGDYEKSKFVYDTLITNVDYDIESPNNQNIISVFLNQATVCQGYADAVSYLLDKLGIQSTIVVGEANNESHAWNLVRLDGAYYYLDTTWGNSRYLDADATEGNLINYAYLNITSEEIAQTHRTLVDFELPECVALDDNYYNREGLYFSEWDPHAIGEAFGRAYAAGDAIVSVKFSGNHLYQQAMDYFLVQGRIGEYCRGLNSVAYIESKEMSVLTFMF